MGKEKRIKTFKELHEEVKNMEISEFESFARKNKTGKEPILNKYGLSYHDHYVGRYSKRSRTVTLVDKINPFTKEPLCAKTVKKTGISDGEMVLVSLTTFKYNENRTPENVFGCKILRTLSARRKEDKYGGLPVYSKKEIEEERQCIREKEQTQLENKRKKNTEALLSYLESCQQQHGFEPGFYHYTDFENFQRIMARGEILSRKTMDALGVEFHDSARNEAINNTELLPLSSVRFFYGPKTPFLYVTEGIKSDSEIEHIANPVLLLFDNKIAYNENVTYLDGSGSHVSDKAIIKVTHTQNPLRAMRFDWDTIFSRGSISGSNKGIVITKRNAEFLFPDRINICFIKKIVFRSSASMRMAKCLLGEDERFATEDVMTCFNYDTERIVNGRSYSINYLEDYDFTVVGNTIIIELEFRTSCTGLYSHSLELIFKDCKKMIDVSDQCNGGGFKVRLIYEDPDYSNVEKINYYLNGHLSAVWIKGKEI